MYGSIVASAKSGSIDIGVTSRLNSAWLRRKQHRGRRQDFPGEVNL
jgi:hypothetical protein